MTKGPGRKAMYSETMETPADELWRKLAALERAHARHSGEDANTDSRRGAARSRSGHEEQAMNKYPEHEKMKAVKERSQIVGEFLEWLESQSMEVCHRHTYEYEPTDKSREGLLAEYFEIDLKKISAEKDAMCAELVANNERCGR